MKKSTERKKPLICLSLEWIWTKRQEIIHLYTVCTAWLFISLLPLSPLYFFLNSSPIPFRNPNLWLSTNSSSSFIIFPFQTFDFIQPLPSLDFPFLLMVIARGIFNLWESQTCVSSSRPTFRWMEVRERLKSPPAMFSITGHQLPRISAHPVTGSFILYLDSFSQGIDCPPPPPPLSFCWNHLPSPSPPSRHHHRQSSPFRMHLMFRMSSYSSLNPADAPAQICGNNFAFINSTFSST